MSSMDDFFGSQEKQGDFDPNAGNNPKPHLGKQICLVKIYGPKETQKKGVILRCDLMIVQPAPGSTYTQGSHVGMAWFVNESDATKRRYERARAGDFVITLLGLPEKTVYGPHSHRLSQADQPGRGLLIAVIGEANKQYLNYRFEHIPQTAEQIRDNRAIVDRVVAAQEAAALPGGGPMPQHMQQQVPIGPPPQQYQQPPQQVPYVPQQPMQQQYYQQPSPQVPQQPQPTGIPGFNIKF